MGAIDFDSTVEMKSDDAHRCQAAISIAFALGGKFHFHSHQFVNQFVEHRLHALKHVVRHLMRHSSSIVVAPCLSIEELVELS